MNVPPQSIQETAAQLARMPATLSTWLAELPADVWHQHEAPNAFVGPWRAFFRLLREDSPV
jgi:hypothetical protein